MEFETLEVKIPKELLLGVVMGMKWIVIRLMEVSHV